MADDVNPKRHSAEGRNIALTLDLGRIDVRWTDQSPGRYGDATVYLSLAAAVRDARAQCKANAQPWIDAIDDLDVMTEEDVRDA